MIGYQGSSSKVLFPKAVPKVVGWRLQGEGMSLKRIVPIIDYISEYPTRRA